jgi:hypothetical protein
VQSRTDGAHVTLRRVNSTQLLQAYLEAEYLVPPGDRLLVGRDAAALAARLPDVTHFALLTAWNPGSAPTPPPANLAAQAALDKDLAAAGVRFLPALNRARGGGHEEASRLLLDAGDACLDLLACRYRQAGALAWRGAGPVRLRIYRPEWAAAAEAAGLDTRFIDWVACAPT